MVRTARRLRAVDDDDDGDDVDVDVDVDVGADDGAPTVTARTASATASSSREASKKMFEPTEMTRRVIGGREGALWGLGVRVGGG